MLKNTKIKNKKSIFEDEERKLSVKNSTHTQLLHRVHRVSGQVQGIERMIAEEKDCLSIIQQIVAARSALTGIATKLLAAESCKLGECGNSKKFEQIIINLLNFQK